MEPTCPRCSEAIAPENVNVKADVAYCRACNETFPLSQMVDRASRAPERTERPPNASVVFASVRGEHLAASLPRGSSRALGCGMLFFTLFWNAITWFFVLGPPSEGEGPMRYFLFLFMIPFILIGIGTLLGTIYILFGKVSLAMNREALLVRREVLGLRFQSRYPIATITGVYMAESYRQNNNPVLGVGIFLSDKRTPVTFGSSLPKQEKAWLTWEIYDFWKSVSADHA
jgi:hypothetical protein